MRPAYKVTAVSGGTFCARQCVRFVLLSAMRRDSGKMETDQSCCSRQRCCGIPMVTGSLVFAIINAVIVGVSVVLCLVYAVITLNVYLDPAERRALRSNSLASVIALICPALCLASLIAAAFAILLCVGLVKRNHRYVMAYLVYGILVELLSVGGVGAFLYVMSGEPVGMEIAAIFLGICLIYALMLLLVYRTYVVLSDTPPASHRKLLNGNDC